MTETHDRKKTRERLLDATVDLLRTQGPAATGTQAILVRADAPRGSFYFHFPDGKDQLVAEALERAAAATADAIVTALQDRSMTMPARVETLFRSVADALAADDYRLGCAIGATVLEASSTSPAFRRLTEAAFASWHSVLTEHLMAEGIDPARADVLADDVIVGLEGATMLARARRDTAPLVQTGVMLGTVVCASVRDAERARP